MEHIGKKIIIGALILIAGLSVRSFAVELPRYTVRVDSINIRIDIFGILDERTVWPSTIRQRSEALYSLYERGFFPMLRYLQREQDWVAVHLFVSEPDTIVLWQADWLFWYGDSAVVSEDYVTERNMRELITAVDVLRVPSDGLMIVQHDGGLRLAIGFKKGTFQRLERSGDMFTIKRPDSITVVNRWR